MGELRKVNLGSGHSIYVEVDDIEAELKTLGSKTDGKSPLPNLPEGAEPVGFRDKIDPSNNADSHFLSPVLSIFDNFWPSNNADSHFLSPVLSIFDNFFPYRPIGDAAIFMEVNHGHASALD